jgi:predicted RNA-binding protein YlxR (DUF448 family)
VSPERTCIGCRQTGTRDELLRLVVSGGIVVVDQRQRMPGRGAWLHPKQECLGLADRRRAWQRALRLAGPVDVSAVRAWLETPV